MAGPAAMNLAGMQTSRRPAIACAIALTSLAVAFGAMAALHVVQSDLDPFHEPVSFYVHGRHGWLLPVALGFFGVAAVALATPAACLSAAARRLLRVFAFGMLVTAVVPSDRWFPWEAAPTAGGVVHAAFAVIAPVLLLVAMLAAVRPTLAPIEKPLVAAYLLSLIGSALSLAWGFWLDRAPPFIGLAERVLAVSAVGWIARSALRTRHARSIKGVGVSGASIPQDVIPGGTDPLP